MVKYNLVNSMIGNNYPFFLTNTKGLGDAWYVYQIYSPGINEDYIPYLSLRKISEKTRSNDPHGHGSDILSVCVGSKKNIVSEGPKMIEEFLKKEGTVVVPNGLEFPNIVMEDGNNPQKSLIIQLRDAIRWKNYKFQTGMMVDVLWTQTQFIVFEVCGKKDALWIEARGIYDMLDTNLQDPILYDREALKRMTPSADEIFLGKNKASDLNRFIKKLEWASFDRATIERPFEED